MNTKKTEVQKQLIKFRNQMHNLLIRYPEIRISGDRNGDVCAQITPIEPHSLTEYIYLPTSGKQELITQYALGTTRKHTSTIHMITSATTNIKCVKLSYIAEVLGEDVSELAESLDGAFTNHPVPLPEFLSAFEPHEEETIMEALWSIIPDTQAAAEHKVNFDE